MTQSLQVRPRRSILYMPGANVRAMEKARMLECDGIIFDLEDAVAPSAKVAARELVGRMIDQGDYGYRELVVRTNALDSPWGGDDLEAAARLAIDAVLLPKVESKQAVADAGARLARAGGGGKALWLMVETPQGVQNVEEIAAAGAAGCLVMGTSDLVKELRAEHTASRTNLSYALQ